MTVQLRAADAGEAADLAAFLGRLIHYDRAAAVRLQVTGDRLAVFGRPASFEVLAIRTVLLADVPSGSGEASTGDELDRTVSAGELLEGIDESAGSPGSAGSAATLVVPAAVTGPPWAGVLPPRGGWLPEPGLPSPDAVRQAVASVVAEFRARTEELAPQERTRAALDRIGHEIWSRPVGDSDLPVRAAHAAHSMGFLRPSGAPGARPAAASATTSSATPGRTPAPSAPATPSGAFQGAPDVTALLSSGPWLRLRTPYGSIAVRRAGLGGLNVSVR